MEGFSQIAIIQRRQAKQYAEAHGVDIYTTLSILYTDKPLRSKSSIKKSEDAAKNRAREPKGAKDSGELTARRRKEKKEKRKARPLDDVSAPRPEGEGRSTREAAPSTRGESGSTPSGGMMQGVSELIGEELCNDALTLRRLLEGFDGPYLE